MDDKYKKTMEEIEALKDHLGERGGGGGGRKTRI